MLVSKRMLKLLPQIFWTGTSIAYWSALLIPIMTFQQKHEPKYTHDKELRMLSNCLFAFIAFGVG